VSRFETARRLPSPFDMRGWAAATGADPAELLDLLERARAEYGTFKDRFAAAGGVDAFQDEIGAIEATAKRIAQFQPAFVVALCQTAAYAREVLRGLSGPAAAAGAAADEIDRMIAARMRRQSILYEPGREMTLLMGEAALRTRIASPETMRGQLEHLAQLARLPTAAVGIVPFTAPMPIMPLSGFAIRDELVTVESLGGELEIADPEEVARYRGWIGLLREVALTGPEAAELCRRVAAEER